jgi:2-dehydro-3-deoxygluconokinase
MSQRFLAIGECMVEMAPQNSGDYALSYAGDTFNTAWYMRKMSSADVEVAYLTGAGNDALSKRFTDFIQDAGIVPEIGVVPDRTIGLYMISLENGERSFQYWRSASAARCLAQHLEPLAALKEGDTAYFSGITMAILSDDNREILLAALSTASASGVKVVFDTNLRPRLWKDLDEMKQWVMKAAAVADMTLPSFDDEAEFFGDADKQATMARYHEAGVKQVIVKDGPNPVLFIDEAGNESEFAPTLNASPVDTTAAGDSFNAGFLAAYLGGESMEAAIKAGCDLSYKVVSQRGALVSL